MKCPSCQEDIPDGSNFCGVCGSKIDQDEARQTMFGVGAFDMEAIRLAAEAQSKQTLIGSAALNAEPTVPTSRPLSAFGAALAAQKTAPEPIALKPTPEPVTSVPQPVALPKPAVAPALPKPAVAAPKPAVIPQPVAIPPAPAVATPEIKAKAVPIPTSIGTSREVLAQTAKQAKPAEPARPTVKKNPSTKTEPPAEQKRSASEQKLFRETMWFMDGLDVDELSRIETEDIRNRSERFDESQRERVLTTGQQREFSLGTDPTKPPVLDRSTAFNDSGETRIAAKTNGSIIVGVILILAALGAAGWFLMGSG